MSDTAAPARPLGADPAGAVAELLLFSDQGQWSERLATGLAADGFRVLVDPTGERALDDAVGRVTDIGLVDLRLGRTSPLGVCAALRARGVPSVMALGSLADEATVLAAFAAGADHVGSTDASTRVLVARLRALHRRGRRRAVVEVEASVLDLTLDRDAGTVELSGEEVRLSRQELEVLGLLVSRPGRVVSRRDLAGVWPGLGPDRRLDFVIRRLRQKLEAVDGRRRIGAVRGVGFRYEPVSGS